MPRTKATSATITDQSYPTPSTSPSPSPRSTPLPSLKPGSSTNGTNSPALNLAVPVAAAAALKPPRLQLGQSILGQLLASHKPGRDHNTLSNDASLSLETIRPKEQRRSGLPASWTAFGFSRTPTTPLPSSSVLNAAVSPGMPPGTPAALFGSGLGAGNMEPDQHYQTVLPSAWLEKIRAGLSIKSRAGTEVPPHYVTLPKDIGHPFAEASLSLSSAPRSVFSLFDGKTKGFSRSSQKDSTMSTPPSSRPTSKSKRWSDRSGVTAASPLSPFATTSMQTATPSPGTAAGHLLHPETPTTAPRLTRRSSACELALGDDARELFQKNRPKTLSSAVITEEIKAMNAAQGKSKSKDMDGSL
ncbi:hypothetical protein BG004_000950 [Podila humilis]|nr:hypothetical protein BG004_000950 [Podila humilis]